MGRPFRILYTAFVAKCIGSLLNKMVYYPINLMGIRHGLSPKEQEHTKTAYIEALNELGLTASTSNVHSDLSEPFIEFVRAIIQKRLLDKECAEEVARMSYCACGRVELPVHVLDKIKAEERIKLACFKNNRLICRTCGGEIQEENYNTIYHRSRYLSGNFDIYPKWLSKKYQSELISIFQRNNVLTRRYRPDGSAIRLSSGYTVDPDYSWAHHPAFLSDILNDNDAIIVVGTTHIAKACNSVALSYLTKPSMRILIIAHPMLDFNSTSTFPNPTMSTKEFVRLCGSAKIAKILLSLTFQWSRERSKLNFDEVGLIETCKQENVVTRKIIDYGNIDIVLETISALKRNNILQILKKLRKNQPLNQWERWLIDSITS